MTLFRHTTPTLRASKSKKRPKRRESWRALAKRHGVSTRTLDRWAAAGIISAPEIINGRKYGDPDAAPRLDDVA
jgi:hypothetical protein